MYSEKQTRKYLARKRAKAERKLEEKMKDFLRDCYYSDNSFEEDAQSFNDKFLKHNRFMKTDDMKAFYKWYDHPCPSDVYNKHCNELWFIGIYNA